MTKKVEPWMFAAAREWMKRSTGVNRDSYESQQLAEVIASHAPNGPETACVVDEWGPRELEASPSPSETPKCSSCGKPIDDPNECSQWGHSVPSEVAAQPYDCEDPKCACKAEIEHNDH